MIMDLRSTDSTRTEERPREFGRKGERVAKTPIDLLPPSLGGRTVGCQFISGASEFSHCGSFGENEVLASSLCRLYVFSDAEEAPAFGAPPVPAPACSPREMHSVRTRGEAVVLSISSLCEFTARFPENPQMSQIYRKDSSPRRASGFRKAGRK